MNLKANGQLLLPIDWSSSAQDTETIDLNGKDFTLLSGWKSSREVISRLLKLTHKWRYR
jgi:hypothetical protein